MNFFKKMHIAIKNFAKNEKGQTMVEYGLIIALVAIALIIAIILVIFWL